MADATTNLTNQSSNDSNTIKLGDAGVDNIKLGSDQVDKIYLGGELIYEK